MVTAAKTWKATSRLTGPDGTVYRPGKTVPAAVVKRSPWLAKAGLVVEVKR